ncbi:membrane protein insertion efficiency factor YidD [Pseudogracilibacillus auburnensis]|uniref:Putative membrane protein insertion efficiency factor n=1 Tax=Pseudogracilibacillus auburnensis TaxID=1494959 RepID=A0A2V3VWE5_9BACI|nr:membrane protein insertion efficiency factor YidD [Pseudogracilibacillus auburnensis]PXW85151.1 hypothetical protein DFR56_112129 [Pseudogracilibacillus auburnensis]
MKHVFIFFVKFYRKVISPLKPPTCRFYPTCSEYSLQSYERFGAIKGTYLTVVRILKCHPFHPGGVDLVPNDKNMNKSVDPLNK